VPRQVHLSTRSLVSVVVAALAVIALALAAVVAYGASGRDRIAEDTSAAGADLGGMTAAEARAALLRRLGPALQRPVRVHYGRRTFLLAPQVSRVRVDVDAMVAGALERSRRGDALTRGIRKLLGGLAPIREPMRVAYSPAAVATFARHIAQRIDHPARQADVAFTRRGLRRTPARDGVAVRQQALTRAIAIKLGSAGPGTAVEVPIRITRRPRVTLRDLRHRYAWLVGVNRPRKQLRLYRHLHLVKTYRIAVGRIGLETAAGRYEIQTKAIDPPWNVPREPWAGSLAGRIIPSGSPDNPLKARWMGFHDGEGIHGTDDVQSLGTAASHGCIRMSVPDVKQLYRRVPLHAPVFIV
jgi:lipoprotein-anchoring transpeptidase ErfK/SrfK